MSETTIKQESENKLVTTSKADLVPDEKGSQATSPEEANEKADENVTESGKNEVTNTEEKNSEASGENAEESGDQITQETPIEASKSPRRSEVSQLTQGDNVTLILSMNEEVQSTVSKNEDEQEQPQVAVEQEDVIEKEEENKTKKKGKKGAKKKPIEMKKSQSLILDDDFDLSGIIIRSDTDLDEQEDEFEEEEEEVDEDVEEEEQPIDRVMYYDMYETYDKLQRDLQLKNKYLQRKLVDYYRKRRMFHVLKDSQYQSDTQQKYERKLDALDELNTIYTEEQEKMVTQVNGLKEKKVTKTHELKKMFDDLQKKEEETGRDLLTSKTGKQNLDKMIERLLKRQKTQMANMTKLRLQYIKIRNRVTEKQEALKALDNLGDNLHLMDYEQLKVDNRMHQDKLEERENELILLRVKCQNAMQVLAHKREKIAAVDKDIANLQNRLDDVNLEFDDCRERLNYFNQERDNIRILTFKLKEDLGLLSRPKLLRDMEDAQEEIELLTQKLSRIMTEHNIISEQIKIIRKNAPTWTKSVPSERTSKKTIQKGRPTLIPLRESTSDI